MFSEGGEGLQDDKPRYIMTRSTGKHDARMGGLAGSVWFAIRKH
jgi:hypothetical protein